MTFLSYTLWHILKNHDISWQLVVKIKNIILLRKNAVFLYALFDSFWGSAGFIDSPTSLLQWLTFWRIFKSSLGGCQFGGYEEDFFFRIISYIIILEHSINEFQSKLENINDFTNFRDEVQSLSSKVNLEPFRPT